jgi:hypothetical protein
VLLDQPTHHGEQPQFLIDDFERPHTLMTLRGPGWFRRPP